MMERRERGYDILKTRWTSEGMEREEEERKDVSYKGSQRKASSFLSSLLNCVGGDGDKLDEIYHLQTIVSA